MKILTSTLVAIGLLSCTTSNKHPKTQAESSRKGFALVAAPPICSAASVDGCKEAVPGKICGLVGDKKCVVENTDIGPDGGFLLTCACTNQLTCPGSCPIEDPQYLSSLIAQLGDEVWSTRDDAKATIQSMCSTTCEGRDIIAELINELNTTANAEVRARLGALIPYCINQANSWCSSHGGVRVDDVAAVNESPSPSPVASTVLSPSPSSSASSSPNVSPSP